MSKKGASSHATQFRLAGRAYAHHGAAAKRRRMAGLAGGSIGILLCALLIGGPFANAARAQSNPQIVRKNGGLKVHYLKRSGCGSKAGAVRMGPPAGVPPIRFTVAATLTVGQQKKECNSRTRMYGLRWRFFVPDVPEETKILILYFKYGDGSPSAEAHLLK